MVHEHIPFFEDEATKRQDGAPTVERETINAVLWNPARDEVLCLDWGKFGWRTFIIGGIDEGEDPERAARREIAEETGFQDIELVADLGKHTSAYYAAHKGENRIAYTTGLLFKLVSDKRTLSAIEASSPHTAQWIPRAAVADFLTPSSQKYIWEQSQLHLS